MLDLFTVLTKGGVVLWSREFAEIRAASSGHPIDALIADVLVEERAGIDHYDKDSYRVQWTFANDLGLIFVVVYQRILQLTYIEELLDLAKGSFVTLFSDIVGDSSALHVYDYDEAFDIILNGLEGRATVEKKKVPRKFQDSKKFANTLEGSKVKESPKAEKVSESGTESTPGSPNDIAGKLKKLQLARSGKKSPAKKDLPIKEEADHWNGTVPQDGGKKLDFSESKDDADVQADDWVDRAAMGMRTSDGLYEAAEMDDVDDDEDDEARDCNALEDSVAPILAKMKEHLITKNVASEIAETLCNSVSSSLIGQKHGISLISSTRILTPRTSTDILRDVMAAKAEGRPYSFVFIGVNGVGKSTNLSKVCFWLIQNGLKILIAACDTFRSGLNLTALESGAVVDLYERGYGKDSAAIARTPLTMVISKQHKYDVVLVDTAGRMQDNEPLMRALAKVYASCRSQHPDKIIFVGEALVGNESVDQLTKFNQALRDFSGMANPRQVDGIILTKFDTVDDKVGAALSMTYITGQPILFVGTGQTYTDLKRMNVKSIVSTLLS
ncbi:SRP54-type protein [Chytridium lagenaria]|nr:SRP54-type protein [Chytridium lagenaria]